jgi:hypothetical protein
MSILRALSWLVLPLLVGRAVAGPPPLWSGNSGGFHVTITADSLVAADRRGRAVFELKSTVEEPREGVPSVSYVPLSLVGPYLSLESDLAQSEEGAAHVQRSRDYITVDLRAPGRPVALRDWWSEAELLSALLADPYLSDRLKGAKARIASLQTLADEIDRLNDCHLQLPEPTIRSFAFHRRIDSTHVAVRVGLANSCIQDEIIQLGIVLPIPAALAPDLAEAAASRRGFLMNASRRLFGESFSIGPR